MTILGKIFIGDVVYMKELKSFYEDSKILYSYYEQLADPRLLEACLRATLVYTDLSESNINHFKNMNLILKKCSSMYNTKKEMNIFYHTTFKDAIKNINSSMTEQEKKEIMRASEKSEKELRRFILEIKSLKEDLEAAFLKYIADRLREVMDHYDLTVLKASEILGIKPEEIEKWLSGQVLEGDDPCIYWMPDFLKLKIEWGLLDEAKEQCIKIH